MKPKRDCPLTSNVAKSSWMLNYQVILIFGDFFFSYIGYFKKNFELIIQESADISERNSPNMPMKTGAALKLL